MNKSDLKRNLYMLDCTLGKEGYDWWWHSFTAYERKTGKEKAFFIEYYICNPDKGGDEAIFEPYPSYCMIKVGTWGKDKREINNFYGINEFKYNKDKLDITIGQSTLTEKHMKGTCTLTKDKAMSHKEYMSDYGSMSWDINIDKKIAYSIIL